MDGEHDGAALVRHAPQQAHHIVGVLAGQAAGGLVQQEQAGLGDELLGQVDPLALSP
jgi:hypothetical protein